MRNSAGIEYGSIEGNLILIPTFLEDASLGSSALSFYGALPYLETFFYLFMAVAASAYLGMK